MSQTSESNSLESSNFEEFPKSTMFLKISKSFKLLESTKSPSFTNILKIFCFIILLSTDNVSPIHKVSTKSKSNKVNLYKLSCVNAHQYPEFLWILCGSLYVDSFVYIKRKKIFSFIFYCRILYSKVLKVSTVFIIFRTSTAHVTKFCKSATTKSNLMSNVINSEYIKKTVQVSESPKALQP